MPTGISYPPRWLENTSTSPIVIIIPWRVINNYSAVQLFLSRARHIDSGLDNLEKELPFIIRICEYVQGIPGHRACRNLVGSAFSARNRWRNRTEFGFLIHRLAGSSWRQHSMRAVLRVLGNYWTTRIIALNINPSFGSFSLSAGMAVSGSLIRYYYRC